MAKLYTSVANRLEAYRAKAAQNDKSGYTWRNFVPKPDRLRFYRGTWQSLESMGPRQWVSDREYYGTDFSAFRDARPCDEVARGIDHTGWFTDEFQDGSYRGYVLRLSGHDGKPRFVAGMAHSDYDGVTVWPNQIFDEETDCALAADRNAELAADKEREYQAEESRKLEIEEARDAIRLNRSVRRELIREMKQARAAGVFYGAICFALRKRLEQLREESHEAYEQIRTLS